MHFYNLIKDLSDKEDIVLFVDMDGVIASYEYGKPLDFRNKRPLKTNIKVFEDISKLENVSLCILSICRKNSQIEDKNNWLDKYAPFFTKENRFILSKEVITNTKSSMIKLNFLKQFKTDKKKVLIDDDNNVLNTIGNNLDDVILFQDSELID